MPAKNTKQIRTLNAKHSDAVPVYFPDMETAASLPLSAGVSTEFPPSTEGGLWWLVVPPGKTIWQHAAPMTAAEEVNFELLKQRAIPIWGPIYFPIGVDNGDFHHFTPEGGDVVCHVVRQKNEGAA